jgi:hypothetical protein
MLTQLIQTKNHRFLEAGNRGFSAGFAVLLMAAIFSLSLVGCDNANSPDDGDPIMGPIRIAAYNGGETLTNATTGDTLHANLSGYYGSEVVTYEWKKDGTVISSGINAWDYLLSEVGVYTVTVSAPGYRSITSPEVTVGVAPTTSAVSVSLASVGYRVNSSKPSKVDGYQFTVRLTLSEGQWKYDRVGTGQRVSTMSIDTFKALVNVTFSENLGIKPSDFTPSSGGGPSIGTGDNGRQSVCSKQYVYFEKPLNLPSNLGTITVTLDAEKLAELLEHTTVTGSLTAGTTTATESWAK